MSPAGRRTIIYEITKASGEAAKPEYFPLEQAP
jgi:hypothetical protein